MHFDLVNPLLHREILSPLYINMELHRWKSKGLMPNYALKVPPVSLGNNFAHLGTSGRAGLSPALLHVNLFPGTGGASCESLSHVLSTNLLDGS